MKPSDALRIVDIVHLLPVGPACCLELGDVDAVDEALVLARDAALFGPSLRSCGSCLALTRLLLLLFGTLRLLLGLAPRLLLGLALRPSASRLNFSSAAGSSLLRSG